MFRAKYAWVLTSGCYAMQMVNRGGLEEMTSLLWLIAQDTEQKVTPKPDAEGEAKSSPDAEKPSAVAGSSSSGGAGGCEKTPHSSYSGTASQGTCHHLRAEHMQAECASFAALLEKPSIQAWRSSMLVQALLIQVLSLLSIPLPSQSLHQPCLTLCHDDVQGHPGCMQPRRRQCCRSSTSS